MDERGISLKSQLMPWIVTCTPKIVVNSDIHVTFKCLPRGAGISLPDIYARHNICTEVISISLSQSPALAYEDVCSTCRMWGHESLFAGYQLDLLIFSRYQNDIAGCPTSSFHAHFTFMIFGCGWLVMAGQWSCACEWGGWGAPHWGGEDWAIWGHEARCCI